MNTCSNQIAIAAANSEQLSAVVLMAKQFHLPIVELNQTHYRYLLVVTSERLELREATVKNSKPVYVDFLSPDLAYRCKHGGGYKQLIAKAVGVKSNYYPKVLDLTAGLGVDGYVLAVLGCEVMLVERSPIIWLLLEDGLRRLSVQQPQKQPKISAHFSQAIDYINKNFYMAEAKPDVIYLDPMYPERDKAALGKKQLRILKEIVGMDLDADKILPLALIFARKRVVVKRPRTAPFLATMQPNLSFSSGKSSRYDIYLIH